MNVRQQLNPYLQTHKKSTISLAELEALLAGQACSYREFAEAVLGLETDGVLQSVRSQGRNGKEPPLAYQYRIQKSRLKQELHIELHQARLKLHPLIQLDRYYSLSPDAWQQDRSFIEQIDSYLQTNALPETAVPAPERSFELVHDEKWITEQHGQELLERVGLWSKLQIIPVADPLMMAFNPRSLSNAVHHHLIVENKTTYQALLQALPDVPFTTLIYGCGKKIIKSIELFPLQLPLADCEHRFTYFGDLDKEGINIWYGLQRKINKLFAAKQTPAAEGTLNASLSLALPFYTACLQRQMAIGKETQRADEEAQQAFLEYFPIEQQIQIRTCLASGGYYPQEILRTQELCHIWRSSTWTH
jgi:hypothetical protein